MSSDVTPDEMRKSLEPRSDQLNADDLVTGPITVRVVKVRAGNTKEQPIFVDLEGYPGRPWKPCKIMRRVLVGAWEDDGREWVGKSITLFCDPDVMYGGVRVGGIRISHLSDLKKEKTFIVTLSRGKKAEVTIHPIDVSQDATIAQALANIAIVTTKESLKAVGVLIKKQPKAVQDAVRNAYAARQKALSEPAQQPSDGTLAVEDIKRAFARAQTLAEHAEVHQQMDDLANSGQLTTAELEACIEVSNARRVAITQEPT